MNELDTITEEIISTISTEHDMLEKPVVKKQKRKTRTKKPKVSKQDNKPNPKPKKTKRKKLVIDEQVTNIHIEEEHNDDVVKRFDFILKTVYDEKMKYLKTKIMKSKTATEQKMYLKNLEKLKRKEVI